MAGAFTLFTLFLFPLGVAGYLTYRIRFEIREGRSYLRGWNDIRTEPTLYWFNIAVKALGALTFLSIPLNIFWGGMRSLLK